MRILTFVLAVGLVYSPLAHAQSLDQQERCAHQARRSFQEIDTQSRVEGKQLGMNRVSGDYQSHYNTKMGKCFMLVETTDMLGSQSSTTAYLMDANERRQYAIYLWISRQDKKYWEVPPTTCELTPNLREKKFCTSREDFDAFVANYMEE